MKPWLSAIVLWAVLSVWCSQEKRETVDRSKYCSQEMEERLNDIRKRIDKVFDTKDKDEKAYC